MRSKFIFKIFLFLILISCQHDNYELIEEGEFKTEVKEILSLDDSYKALLAFNALSPEGQATFWRNRLTFIINSEKYSVGQVGHIKSLLSRINPLLYQKDILHLEEFNKFADDWIQRGLELFSKEDLFFIAFQINTNKTFLF